MNNSDTLNKLIEIFEALRPGLLVENVSRDCRLKEDLAVDSITLLLLALRVETAFSIRFDNLNPNDIVTVGDVCDYVDKKLKS